MNARSESSEARQPREPSAPRAAGARHVLVVAAIVVVAVLGLQVVSLVVPPVGEVLRAAPLLIGSLVIVTGLVLAGAMRPRA